MQRNQGKFLRLSAKSWKLLRRTVHEFSDDNGLKLSAALSFYTVLALPPLLIIIISICGFFFGTEAVKGQIFMQINGLVGNEAAVQIQDILKNVSLTGNNRLATISGFVILIVSASGVFAEIQDSINYIWGLKAKPKKGWTKLIKNRLMSFSMMASVGFLLLVSLMINALMDLLSKPMQRYFQESSIHIFYVLNIILVFVIITLLFTLIIRTLPDGRVKLRDALVGASFSAFLFLIGKYLIGVYLANSPVASAYGTAASVIIILVWVYYSAVILYFGAEFTKVYATMYGHKVIPNDYAVRIFKDDIEIPKTKAEKKLAGS